MTSTRPYLIRAVYQWIVDNEKTPYVVINANLLGVKVPKEHIQDGQIILNVSPKAVRDLLISNHSLSFKARFGGVVEEITTPVSAITAIYAKENGKGMVFDEDFTDGGDEGEDNGGVEPEPPTSGPVKKGQRPHLRIVK